MSKPPLSNGHGPLKWGAIAVLVSYATVFLVGTIDENAAAMAVAMIGSLMLMGGVITWAIGMTLRIRFNRRATEPLPFTAGEKVALIGGAALVVGILLANGAFDSDGVGAGRTVGIIGFIAACGGALWHLMTPRHASGTR